MSLKEIQNDMEYQKVVLDQRLRYYEPNGERVYKTFADQLILNFSMMKKVPIFLKKFVHCQNITSLMLKLAY